jgi:chromosome segregation ATPase
VDTVDSRVQAILEAHEGEFLDAYRQHVKKVRDEMEALRRQSSHNANTEQLYLERIQALEKQLAIFRDDSLGLFQKLLAKEKEVTELTGRVKEARADSEESRKKVHTLMRRNKDLEVALLKLQSKEEVIRPVTVRQEGELS